MRYWSCGELQYLHHLAHSLHQRVDVVSLGRQRYVAARPRVQPPVEQSEEQPAVHLRVVLRCLAEIARRLFEEVQPEYGPGHDYLYGNTCLAKRGLQSLSRSPR